MRKDSHLLSTKPKMDISAKKHDYGFFYQISHLSWPLFWHNTLFIDDCPYKCVGNVSFSYILPHPFDNEVDNNNYLLASLWLYLIGLSKTLRVCWFTPSWEKMNYEKNSHWKSINFMLGYKCFTNHMYICRIQGLLKRLRYHQFWGKDLWLGVHTTLHATS